jgi:5-methyltetrahydrofolate--homocysteine methyltransferase
MPLCVQELHARRLDFPVLVGGAAINPSFVRNAAYLDRERETIYPSGLFYCKDAFAGLATVDALQDPERREDFLRARLQEIREGVAKRAALQERAKAMRAGLAGPRSPSREIEIPRPAFWGVKVLERLPLAQLFPLIDLNTLYRLHWGAKNAKGAEWERLLKEEFEPRLERYQRETLAGGWLQTQAAYGFFPAASDGNDLVVYDPKDADREVARFAFPRQDEYDKLSLADYFIPVGNGERDVVAFQIVCVGDALLKKSDGLMKAGDYSEGYYLHGFGVRLAEAGAEYVHARIRDELGIDPGRGLRYSWGYGACPDHRQHRIVFQLLPARERLGMDLTDAGALIPELSTAALVVHHPEAKYFSV